MPEAAEAFVAAACGFGAGLALAGGLAGVLLLLPLRRVARACRRLQCGDLSHTVPEVGTGDLRSVARTVNDLDADFQEVLLLFAHHSRSARETTRVLRQFLANPEGAQGDHARRLAEVVDDLDRMQATIRDFRYFRVVVDDESIRDTGIAVPSPAGAAPQVPGRPLVGAPGYET